MKASDLSFSFHFVRSEEGKMSALDLADLRTKFCMVGQCLAIVDLTYYKNG
jgi:hypothetical protein